MAIEPKKYGDSYDEMTSRIFSMAKVLKNYQQDFDMIKSAEMNYERMRTLNNTTLLQVDLKKSAGNILGSLSVDSIWNSPGDRAITAALAEARASILSRAVGPLEGLPVGDYIQDSVRAKNVISHTMLGAEQRLISRLSQMKGNKWNNAQQYNGAATILTDGGVSDPRKLQENLKATEVGTSNIDIIGPVQPPAGNLTNKWHPSKYGSEYNSTQAQEYNKNFNFTIVNRATGVRKAFPAHIKNLNEAVSPTWNNISLINRSEDLYVYQRAERTFNLEFVIFASVLDGVIDPNENFPNLLTISGPSSEQDPANQNTIGTPTITVGGEEVGLMSKKMMWDRINFLHSLTRPTYTSDGKYNKAPYCSLFLGDLFRGITVIFDSININYDPMIWDLNVDPDGGIKPMIAEITTSGKFLHSVPPSATHNFYGRTSN